MTGARPVAAFSLALTGQTASNGEPRPFDRFPGWRRGGKSDDTSNRRNVRAGKIHPMSRSQPNLEMRVRRRRARHASRSAHSAAAADLPLKAPALKTVYDWTGFYIGGHVGYGGGSLGPGTNPLPEEGVFVSAQHHRPDRRLSGRLQPAVLEPCRARHRGRCVIQQSGRSPRLAPSPLQYDARLRQHGTRPGRIRVRTRGCHI